MGIVFLKKELFWGVGRDINFALSGKSAALTGDLNMGTTREVYFGISRDLPSPRDMKTYINAEIGWNEIQTTSIFS